MDDVTTRNRFALITTVLLVLSLLTSQSPATSARASEVSNGAAQKLLELDETARSWEQVDEGERRRLLVAWNRQIGRSASGGHLDLSAAEAFQTADGEVLRMPFKNGDHVLPESNVSVLFDGDHRLRGWSELVLTPLTSTSGRLQTFANGERQLDRVVADTDVPVSARSTWWSRFSNCLNSAGVAAWAVAALSLACSAACIATAGVACIVCLSAASAVTSGTISYCVQKANRG